MFKFNVEEKEYGVRYEYESAYKSKIISKVVALENADDSEGIDLALGLLPELLLVGLQAEHYDEFGYNWDNNEGKDEQLHKVFGLLDTYLSGEDAVFFDFFSALQEQLVANGFLASVFRKEVQKAEQKKSSAKKK